MKQYLDLLRHVMENGSDRGDRTGTGTRGVFGYQMRFLMADGLPILTTKRVHLRSVIHELLWFLRGETNVRSLQANGVTIWNEWANPSTGDLGPIYGKQWRKWDGQLRRVDQIGALVKSIQSDPFSRRHIVTAWNPSEIAAMALPPCHCLFQCYVDADCLSLHLYARSIDSFLGLPFNIASYSILLHMLAQVSGLMPGELVISFGDLHIYNNHFEQVKTQLSRTPGQLPSLRFTRDVKSIDDFRFEDFSIEGYDPQPAISAPVSV